MSGERFSKLECSTQQLQCIKFMWQESDWQSNAAVSSTVSAISSSIGNLHPDVYGIKLVYYVLVILSLSLSL